MTLSQDCRIVKSLPTYL